MDYATKYDQTYGHATSLWGNILGVGDVDMAIMLGLSSIL